ncbi:60S acidic ribosomal protein P2-3 [Zea mays]|jgi:large subunit ribosomal protein LP2|uniref:60S acidic ribosomal protein P2-3 n=1 Tax=Zea mays TaxID=4577 RepID=A0A3L6E3W7_MAIZE|nr:60S acidic ribosomal protein P2-3 [Zea mays]
MEFLAAYLLPCLGAGPAPALPTKDDVRRILRSVSAEVEEDRLDLVFALLEVKDIAELIATGGEHLAYAPSGAAAAVVAAPAAAEVEEEATKEEDEDIALFNLFD